jgi:hypothetical protein
VTTDVQTVLPTSAKLALTTPAKTRPGFVSALPIGAEAAVQSTPAPARRNAMDVKAPAMTTVTSAFPMPVGMRTTSVSVMKGLRGTPAPRKLTMLDIVI